MMANDRERKGEMRYLVTSNDRPLRLHTDYSAALADVRRRLGVRELRRNGRQTRRDLDPAERIRQFDGIWWRCAKADDYMLPAKAGGDPTLMRSVTLYCLECGLPPGRELQT